VKRKIKGDAKNGPVVDLTQITKAFTTLKTANKDRLVMLNVQPDGYVLKPLKNQIRKFFQWKFSPDGTCRSRELTGSGAWTTQVFEKIVGKGKATKIVEEEEVKENFEEE